MAGIKLPIEVGQKFLSDGEVVEIISVTRKHKSFPVVAVGDTTGNVSVFSTEGKYFHDRDNDRDLQPIPVVITEGVEFCGPEYRDEFERLVKAGRKFEVRIANGEWIPCRPEFHSEPLYRLVPQHADANGNALKVGDRVQGRHATRITIARFENGLAIDENENSEYLVHCHKLTTRKRPLCADDLMANRTALFRYDEGQFIYPISSFDIAFAYLDDTPHEYRYLQEKWEWSPSAGQPWGPCEVEEEVLA